jgi:dipeptidyl aminopeptidase/acylaminoacyl peptidase
VAAGTADAIVEVTESKRLVTELERHKVPHEVMMVREEGHAMYHLKNRVELYDRIAAFLEANLK